MQRREISTGINDVMVLGVPGTAGATSTSGDDLEMTSYIPRFAIDECGSSQSPPLAFMTTVYGTLSLMYAVRMCELRDFARGQLNGHIICDHSGQTYCVHQPAR
jgi:hypothetical protein